MTWLNAAGAILGILQSTGVINILGSEGAGIATVVITAVNGLAHALSPATPGPFTPVKS